MNNSVNKSIVIGALLLACGLCVASIVMSFSIKNFYSFNKYVDVKGLDERVVKSNLASWQISFTTSANDLTKIYATVSESQNKIMQFLFDAGFQQSEIERLPITVNDLKSDAYSQRSSDTPRYKATAGIMLVTNKIDLVSQTSQKTNMLLQQGIVLMGNAVQYSFTDLNSIKADMLDKATKNAQEAALSFANIAHTQLGTIRRAQQGLFTITSAGAGNDFDNSSIMKRVRVVTNVQFFLN